VKKIRKVRRRRINNCGHFAPAAVLGLGNEKSTGLEEEQISSMVVVEQEKALMTSDEEVLVHDKEEEEEGIVLSNHTDTSKSTRIVTESVSVSVSVPDEKDSRQKAFHSTIDTTTKQSGEAAASARTTKVISPPPVQNKPQRPREAASAAKRKRKSQSQRQRSKSKKSTSSSKSKSGIKSAVGGGKSGECLRRIKREWKDAVKLGIAYDWTSMQTVTIHGRSARSGSCGGGGITPPPPLQDFLEYNYVRIGPMGKNLLRWHFSVRGPFHSDYEHGIYHGRVLLPKDYPGSPPRIQMLTPSGRFITGEDICLSASAYHPETWTPRWTVLSLVDALRLHMLTSPNEIGGLDATKEVRRKLAIQSRSWRSGNINHLMMVQAGLFRQGEQDDNEADLLTSKNDFKETTPRTHVAKITNMYPEHDEYGSGTSTQSAIKGAVESGTTQRQSLIVCIVKGVLELLLNSIRNGVLLIAKLILGENS
jgi:ubiquitin-protein ligase